MRLVAVQAGETLIEAGAPSGFVYIPLGDGLQVFPLGGYVPFAVRRWMPLVITGVIRNAHVRAVAPVDVLIISSLRRIGRIGTIPMARMNCALC